MSGVPASPRLVDRLWTYKWLLGACLLVSLVATNIALTFYPARYRSHAAILVVPSRVPDEYVHSPKTGDIEKRIGTIQQQVFSRTRLERIIMEFNLYAEERKHGMLEDVIQEMRSDISVKFTNNDSFMIGFEGSDPRTVTKVTERLTALFISENLADRANIAEGTGQFIEGQLKETHRRLDEQEALMNTRKKSGHALSISESIEYDVLQQQYRDLLTKHRNAIIAENLERRQIGEQFKLLDAARIPEEPISPNRIAVHAGGAATGLGLGIALIGFRSRRRQGVVPPAAAPDNASATP